MKHASRFIMIALLYNGIAYPIPSLNFGKELIQKSTGWIANNVPWWVPWVSVVLFCGAQWQRDHNRWQTSEKEKSDYYSKWQESERKFKTLEEEKKDLRLSQKGEQLDDSWKKVCEDLGIENADTMVKGLIEIKPKPDMAVIVGNAGLVYISGANEAPSVLQIHAEECPEKLHINMYLKDQKIAGGDLKPFPLLRKKTFVLTKEWFDLSADHNHLLRTGWLKP